MILCDSEIEQLTLKVIRDEGGDRDAWPLGRTGNPVRAGLAPAQNDDSENHWAWVNDAQDDRLAYDGQPQGLPLPGRTGNPVPARVNHAPTQDDDPENHWAWVNHAHTRI